MSQFILSIVCVCLGATVRMGVEPSVYQVCDQSTLHTFVTAFVRIIGGSERSESIAHEANIDSQLHPTVCHTTIVTK